MHSSSSYASIVATMGLGFHTDLCLLTAEVLVVALVLGLEIKSHGLFTNWSNLYNRHHGCHHSLVNMTVYGVPTSFS